MTVLFAAVPLGSSPRFVTPVRHIGGVMGAALETLAYGTTVKLS